MINHVKGVPELAVELRSPNDTNMFVRNKAGMWVAHGTEVRILCTVDTVLTCNRSQ